MRRSLNIGTLAIVLVAILLAVVPVSASATGTSVWRVNALSDSSAFRGGTLNYIVEVRNVGSAPAEGPVTPISITLHLPAGIHAVSAANVVNLGPLNCPGSFGTSTVTCTTTATFPPNRNGVLRVATSIEPGATVGPATAAAEVTGGGALTPASTFATTSITDEAPVFGIDTFDGLLTADATGAPFSQAGGTRMRSRPRSRSTRRQRTSR